MTTNRYIAMSVPGDRDDGADTGWHVYDRQDRRSRKVGNGPDAARRAIELEASPAEAAAFLSARRGRS